MHFSPGTAPLAKRRLKKKPLSNWTCPKLANSERIGSHNYKEAIHEENQEKELSFFQLSIRQDTHDILRPPCRQNNLFGMDGILQEPQPFRATHKLLNSPYRQEIPSKTAGSSEKHCELDEKNTRAPALASARVNGSGRWKFQGSASFARTIKHSEMPLIANKGGHGWLPARRPKARMVLAAKKQTSTQRATTWGKPKKQQQLPLLSTLEPGFLDLFAKVVIS